MLLLAIILRLLYALTPCHAISFWVDGINGNDTNDGSASAPFATIWHTVDVVRALDRPLTSSVYVNIRAGDYDFTDSPWMLSGYKDSGDHNYPIIFRAVDGKVRILGGKVVPHYSLQKIEKDSKVHKLSSQLSAKTLSQMRIIDLRKAGITDFGKLTPRGGCCNQQHSSGCPSDGPLELFFNSQPLTIARFPNLIPILQAGNNTRLTWATTQGSGVTQKFFEYSKSDPFSKWNDWDDVWAHGLWWYDWNDLLSPVNSIDKHNQRIYLATPYPPNKTAEGGITHGARYWLQNSFDALDNEGEYYLNRSSSLLYFILPEGATKDGEALVSMSSLLLHVDNVTHIQFIGLTFEGARGNGIYVKDSAYVSFINCTVRNVGSSGIEVIQSKHIDILGGEVSHTGCSGIILSGGDTKTLSSAEYVLRDCHLHHWQRVVLTYQPAIKLEGVGIVVQNNDIHTAPHFAIGLSGNDHHIKFNILHHTSMDTFDNGPIYWCPRDWTQRGHHIDSNLFYMNSHKVVPCNSRTSCMKPAIYGDDSASGVLVENNVIWHPNPGFRGKDVSMYGVFWDGGRDVSVQNNIFVDTAATYNSAEGLTWNIEVWCRNDSNYYTLLRDKHWTSAPFSTHYPDLALYKDFVSPNCPQNSHCGPAIYNNSINTNVCVNTSALVTYPHTKGYPPGEGMWQAYNTEGQPAGPKVKWPTMSKWYQIGNNLINKDPKFVSTEPRKDLNFQLTENSPAYGLGFKRIPMDKFGPFNND